MYLQPKFSLFNIMQRHGGRLSELSHLNYRVRLDYRVALLALAMFFSLFSAAAHALSGAGLFQHARESYAAKNEIALTQDKDELLREQYILAPYADYWLMLLRLEKADAAEVESFLSRNADLPFADRMRGEWLKKLAKQQDWQTFFNHYPYYKRDDVAVQCYALFGKALAEGVGEELAQQTRKIWMSATDLPDACTPLFDEVQKVGGLGQEDLWGRFRLALAQSKLALAKGIAARINGVDEKQLKQLDVANQSPGLVLGDNPKSAKASRAKTAAKVAVGLNNRTGVEIYLFALDRLARSDLAAAIEKMQKLQSRLESADAAYAWGRLAYHAARVHHPRALEFYALAKNSVLDREQLAWKTRAALRSQDWNTVLAATALMSQEQMQEGAWRYWRARALREVGQQAEANKLLAPLSKERHYYGWLAAEEMGSMLGNAEQEYKVSDAEVAAVASLPAIKRSIEFARLDMRWEAKSEWAWAIRNFDDKQLLSAAALAMRQEWYDIAITTADNTKVLHDFSLRYPTPYRSLFRRAAEEEGVDEAWIYGLARQESRFMHQAKSGVGAAGLMQIMPATAKWVAKRLGINGYSHHLIHDLNTNVGIGTHYIRYTYELMGGQAVMATAAYNAGPSRARRWQAQEPMDATIYIETIPFSETRNYVQKVMANAQMYAPQLGRSILSLKSRLGVIPGTGRQETLSQGEDSEQTP